MDIALYSSDCEKSINLLNILKSSGLNTFALFDNFAGFAPIENFNENSVLVIAFPELINKSQEELSEIILNKSFTLVQKFVSETMKKKNGKILFLIPAESNGIDYGTDISGNQDFYIMQGGFTGLAKTITKEYGKRGIQANTIYVDWNNISSEQIVSLIKGVCDNSKVQGQVFAIDGGKFM